MIMREIKDHKGITPANEGLTVFALDEPGIGGASHRYKVLGYYDLDNPARERHRQADTSVELLFQNGPVPENGNNGVTEQALVAIVIDRLRSFQRGEFACRENAIALTHLEDAMNWMWRRSTERTLRGVQGTLQK